jgi:hypothetical protein
VFAVPGRQQLFGHACRFCSFVIHLPSLCVLSSLPASVQSPARVTLAAAMASLAAAGRAARMATEQKKGKQFL